LIWKRWSYYFDRFAARVRWMKVSQGGNMIAVFLKENGPEFSKIPDVGAGVKDT